MGKLNNLKEKYNKQVPEEIFNFFRESLIGGSHKYFEYLLKSWVIHSEKTINDPNLLVKWVTNFDALLPYISNKDIYHSDYVDLSDLISINSAADKVKSEKLSRKTKQKEIVILKETDTYLLIFPKSHEASLKYGSDTKWCTAMTGQTSTFTRYRRQYLVYLISKKGTKRNKDYNKIAFYTPSNSNVGINSKYHIYNTHNDLINGGELTTNGWTVLEQIEIDQIYRHFVLTTEMERFEHLKWKINPLTDMEGMFDECTQLTGLPRSAFGQEENPTHPINNIPVEWNQIEHLPSDAPQNEQNRDIIFRRFQHNKLRNYTNDITRSHHNMMMGMDVATGVDKSKNIYHRPIGDININHLSIEERNEFTQKLASDIPFIDHISLLNPETIPKKQTDFINKFDKIDKLFKEIKIWKEQSKL